MHAIPTNGECAKNVRKSLRVLDRASSSIAFHQNNLKCICLLVAVYAVCALCIQCVLCIEVESVSKCPELEWLRSIGIFLCGRFRFTLFSRPWQIFCVPSLINALRFNLVRRTPHNVIKRNLFQRLILFRCIYIGYQMPHKHLNDTKFDLLTINHLPAKPERSILSFNVCMFVCVFDFFSGNELHRQLTIAWRQLVCCQSHGRWSDMERKTKTKRMIENVCVCVCELTLLCMHFSMSSVRGDISEEFLCNPIHLNFPHRILFYSSHIHYIQGCALSRFFLELTFTKILKKNY